MAVVRNLSIEEARTYLRVQKGEIQRMQKEDGFPVTVIPGENLLTTLLSGK